MKKFLKTILSFAMVLGCISLTPMTNTYASEQYDKTFPYVQSYETTNNTMTLGQESRILVIENTLSLNDDKVLANIELISSQLGTILSKSPNIVFGSQTQILPNDIVIELKEIEELKDKEDSYKIEISDHIKITSKDNAGVFYAIQSLIQLLKVNDFVLPQGTIIDYPDTKERSLHLDLARKYFTIDWIKDLIEDMAYLKMDSLQIHFSEHEAYRLESEVLNNVSGFRYPSNYYTKEQMAEIVRYAQMHHIDVIPSLDSPGHMRYVLGFLPANYKLSSVSNVSNDGAATGAFNIFNKDARDFIKSMFREYAEFFSELGCTKMNIGGDEFLNNFSLLTGEQYADLMEYFNEIAAIIREYGMTGRAWNDGVMFSTYDKSTYTFDSSIDICYWAGVNNAATIEDFVKNGNKVLNYSDVFMYYVLSSWWDANANPSAERIYNNWYTGYLADARVNNVIVQQKYDEPYPDYLLGSSFAIWCDVENYRTEDQMRTQIKDRMRAMATKAWNTEDNMPTYASMQASFDKAGRAPAYQTTLPAAGEIFRNEDSSAVVLKYVDTDGQSISADKIIYGVTGDSYSLEHKLIYGYKFVSSSKPLNGTFNGQETIVLTYELGTDKSVLEKHITQPLQKDDYVLKTYKAYNDAYKVAKAVYDNAKATQNEVDEAVTKLEEAKTQLVLKSYETLYNIVDSAIKEKGSYTETSYNAYKAEVNSAKALLTNDNVTQEQMNNAIAKIDTARNNLKLDKSLTITTNIPQYSTYSVNNVIDGNIGTKFWGNGAQNIGDYFLIEFREPVMLSQLEIYSGYDSANITNGDSIKGADIMVSVDNHTWTKVGAIDGDNHEVVKFDEVKAKYVKVVFTKDSGNWPQLNDIMMNYSATSLDKTELIKEVESLDSSLYTKESFAYVTKAANTLKELNTNNYDEQAIAFYNVRVAIDNLVEVTVDDMVEPEKPFPFEDVFKGQWYYEYVDQAYQLGLMTGATETLFKPVVSMNRGMVAIVLHRMEGAEEVPFAPIFPDVYDKQYFTTAVMWAKQTGIITGYNNGTFMPLKEVTREEMATMIQRFAKYKGLDVASSKDITYFQDYADISTYAKAPIQWCVENGVLSGKFEGTKVDPLGTATRAECAKMLVQAYKVIYK